MARTHVAFRPSAANNALAAGHAGNTRRVATLSDGSVVVLAGPITTLQGSDRWFIMRQAKPGGPFVQVGAGGTNMQLNQSHSMAITPDNMLWVATADTNQARVYRFTWNGSAFTYQDSFSFSHGGTTQLNAVSIDAVQFTHGSYTHMIALAVAATPNSKLRVVQWSSGSGYGATPLDVGAAIPYNAYHPICTFEWTTTPGNIVGNPSLWWCQNFDGTNVRVQKVQWNGTTFAQVGSTHDLGTTFGTGTNPKPSIAWDGVLGKLVGVYNRDNAYPSYAGAWFSIDSGSTTVTTLRGADNQDDGWWPGTGPISWETQVAVEPSTGQYLFFMSFTNFGHGYTRLDPATNTLTDLVRLGMGDDASALAMTGKVHAPVACSDGNVYLTFSSIDNSPAEFLVAKCDPQPFPPAPVTLPTDNTTVNQHNAEGPHGAGIARFSNGRLIAKRNVAGTSEWYYSDDEGATWNAYTHSGTKPAFSTSTAWYVSDNLTVTEDDRVVIQYGERAVKVATQSGNQLTWSATGVQGDGGDTWYAFGRTAWSWGGSQYAAVHAWNAVSLSAYLIVNKWNGSAWSEVARTGLGVINSWHWADITHKHDGYGAVSQEFPDIYMGTQYTSSGVATVSEWKWGGSSYGGTTMFTFTNSGDPTGGPQIPGKCILQWDGVSLWLTTGQKWKLMRAFPPQSGTSWTWTALSPPTIDIDYMHRATDDMIGWVGVHKPGVPFYWGFAKDRLYVWRWNGQTWDQGTSVWRRPNDLYTYTFQDSSSTALALNKPGHTGAVVHYLMVGGSGGNNYYNRTSSFPMLTQQGEGRWQFLTAKSASSTANTTSMPGYTQGATTGDLMVALVIADTNPWTTLPTPPAGWTAHAQNGTSKYILVYTRIAGGSEPTSYSWTYSSRPNVQVTILVFEGGSAPGTPTVSDTGDVAVPANTWWSTRIQAPDMEAAGDGVAVFAAISNRAFADRTINSISSFGTITKNIPAVQINGPDGSNGIAHIGIYPVSAGDGISQPNISFMGGVGTTSNVGATRTLHLVLAQGIAGGFGWGIIPIGG